MARSGRWEPLPHIVVPSHSPFNNRSGIHLEIEEAFLSSVRDYEKKAGERLIRVIRKGEDILSWWENLCWISQSKLREQSEKIGELWKEAENSVREHHGIPRIGEGWVSEMALLNLVREVFPHERIIHHARPKWLGSQHLDIFLPERSIAIEYHGEQHFEPIDFFGGWEALDETQKRDQRKFRLCVQNSVRLICFRFDEPITGEIVQQRIEKLSREMD